MKVGRKPGVALKEKQEVLTPEMSALTATPVVEKKGIKVGNLMRIDFLPTFWAK